MAVVGKPVAERQCCEREDRASESCGMEAGVRVAAGMLAAKERRGIRWRDVLKVARTVSEAK